MSRRPELPLACLLLLVTSGADAATITVKKGGPHPTIASGIAAAAAGDTVKVEAGVYPENLIIPITHTGLQLIAHGNVVVEARPAGGAPNGPGLRVLADNVTVKGITIRNAAQLDSNARGIGLQVSANGFSAIGVTTLRCEGAGIEIDGDDALVDAWNERGSSKGLSLIDGQGTLIRNSRIRQVNGAGIAINAYTDARIEDCSFELLGSDGISADDPSNAAIEIRRNRFVALDDFAIRCTGAATVIEDNVVADSNSGFSLAGNGFAVRRNSLRGLSGFVAISVDDSASGTISDNEIRNFLDTGIDLRESASGTAVRDNVLRGALNSERAAIRVLGVGSQIDRNQIRDCANDGISVSGDSNTFTDNVVEDCLRDGIDFDGDAESNTATGNTVRRCLAEGLDHSGTSSFIDDNTFEDCRIDVANDGSFSSFTGNTFATGGQATPPEID